MKIYAQDGEFELAPELVRSLCATYPTVNVRRELERMHLWTLKNAQSVQRRTLQNSAMWCLSIFINRHRNHARSSSIPTIIWKNGF